MLLLLAGVDEASDVGEGRRETVGRGTTIDRGDFRRGGIALGGNVIAILSRGGEGSEVTMDSDVLEKKAEVETGEGREVGPSADSEQGLGIGLKARDEAVLSGIAMGEGAMVVAVPIGCPSIENSSSVALERTGLVAIFWNGKGGGERPRGGMVIVLVLDTVAGAVDVGGACVSESEGMGADSPCLTLSVLKVEGC